MDNTKRYTVRTETYHVVRDMFSTLAAFASAEEAKKLAGNDKKLTIEKEDCVVIRSPDGQYVATFMDWDDAIQFLEKNYPERYNATRS